MYVYIYYKCLSRHLRIYFELQEYRNICAIFFMEINKQVLMIFHARQSEGDGNRMTSVEPSSYLSRMKGELN